MGVSKNGGTQQPWVFHGFPTKMVILGCFGGTTIFGNTHMVSIPMIYMGFSYIPVWLALGFLPWKSMEGFLTLFFGEGSWISKPLVTWDPGWFLGLLGLDTFLTIGQWPWFFGGITDYSSLLGGCFKYVLFSPLLGEDSHFD